MPSFTVQQEIYQLKQLLSMRGEPVQFIQRTTLPGSNPAPNPPLVEGLVVNGLTHAGSTTISFRASILTGRLIPGDTFVISGDVDTFTVTAQAISPPTADTLTGVTFFPPLLSDAPDGVAVGLNPSAIINVATALVTHFPPALVKGTSILQTDRRVRVLASDLGSWVPLPGSLVTLASDGNTYEILNVKTVRDQGTVYAYFMQVRV